MATLREVTVFADEGLIVTVTESLELRTSETSRGRFTVGNLKPVAVVVRDSDGTHAFDIDSSVRRNRSPRGCRNRARRTGSATKGSRMTRARTSGRAMKSPYNTGRACFHAPSSSR